MKIELLNGYFIDEKSNDVTLKQKYIGIRKGNEVECEKIISHHSEFEDATQAFLRLNQKSIDEDSLISLNEYLNRITEENRKAVEAIQNGSVTRFYVDVPKCVGNKVEHSIVDLIPVGRGNAITRQILLSKCKEIDLAQSDRAMRSLIEKARIDYTILNLSDGDGYYRPSHDDLLDLKRYIKQEENRAKSVFKNLSMAKKLYEDYKVGRV